MVNHYKKIIAICLVCWINISVQAQSDSSWTKGSGTEEDPFQIGDINDLKQLVEDSKVGNYHKDEYFILTADIVDNENLIIPEDFTRDTPYIEGVAWESIVQFDGHLNGNGHSISGIKGSMTDLIVGPNQWSIYFIEKLNGSIKNLTIKNSFLCSWIGGGSSDTSTIENCVNYAMTRYGFSRDVLYLLKNSGSFGKSYSHGLAGGYLVRAVNCYNYGEVEAKAASSMREPTTYRVNGSGLFNIVYSAVNCFNMGKVTGAENPSGICYQLADRNGEERFSNIVNYGKIITAEGSNSCAITSVVSSNPRTSDRKIHVGDLYALSGSASNLIGDDSYVIYSGVHSFQSETYMQSNDFWEELIDNAIALGTECCQWKWGKDGFPILEIIDEEVAGINDITVSEDEDSQIPIVYFNLQGVNVENPDKGIYIKVQGRKKEKIVFN